MAGAVAALVGKAVMTQPLRTAHRRVVILLAVLLPAAFVSGLAARKVAAPSNPGIEWRVLAPQAVRNLP